MRLRHSIAALLVLAAGCDGVIGEPPILPPDSGPQCVTLDSIGAPVPMRRLTAMQVKRTTSELLDVEPDLAVSDETLFTFRSNISSSLDFAGARGYLDFAEAVTASANLSACQQDDAACRGWLFDELAPRMFRRPLGAAERTRYEALFEAGVGSDGPPEGARWVIESLLQSPSFLYMDEVVREDGYLDDYSMAARLSLTLWGTNPDVALLEKAAAGQLSSAEQVRAEAERLLADPRSQGGMTDFVDQWLRLDRLNDPDARPDLEALGADTLTAMRAEPVQLFRMLLNEDGDLKTLLTTSEAPLLQPLASLYGDDILSTEADRYTLDPTRRAGMLALPGVMAALSHAEATSPTLRGFNVLANFLCTPPSPPPAGVSVSLPDIGPGKTTRERLEAHFDEPTCAACHKGMDGMGFAFESIDWLGRSRDEEFGMPIDDTTTFPLDGEDITVEGAVGLAAAIGDSPDIANCVARQWASYGAGVPDKKETVCLVEHLAEEVQQADGLRTMIINFVTSDWYRRGAEPSGDAQ